MNRRSFLSTLCVVSGASWIVRSRLRYEDVFIQSRTSFGYQQIVTIRYDQNLKFLATTQSLATGVTDSAGSEFRHDRREWYVGDRRIWTTRGTARVTLEGS